MILSYLSFFGANFDSKMLFQIQTITFFSCRNIFTLKEVFQYVICTFQNVIFKRDWILAGNEKTLKWHGCFCRSLKALFLGRQSLFNACIVNVIQSIMLEIINWISVVVRVGIRYLNKLYLSLSTAQKLISAADNKMRNHSSKI